MKRKLLTILLCTMLFTVSCGSQEAPAEPISNVEASATVQEDIKTTELAENTKKPVESITGATATPAPEAKATEAPAKEVVKEAEPTPAPAVTATPVPTEAPKASEPPASTVEPKESESPASTQAPSEEKGEDKPKTTAAPTEEPVKEPEPTEAPKAEETPEPTAEPTEEPKAEETPEPTPEQTPEPTPEPTPELTPAECDHDWDTIVTDEPSCSSDGYEYDKCKKCGELGGYRVLPFLDHDYDSGEVIREGDCATPSVIEYTCKNCGSSYKEEGSTTDEHDWKTKEGTPTVDMITGELIPGEPITYCDCCGAYQ